MTEEGIATPRVLLVDDRPDNLLALRVVLEPLGFDLVCVASGGDALAALLEHEYAVVVMDVQMPGMDGFETARLIKGRERTRLLPIIFLTAISFEPHHHLTGYQAGAVDYIAKPFDPDVLRAKVSVFVEMWRRGALIDYQRQALADQLAAIERLNRELEHSNAALDSFAASAAEDLLEPLDVMAGLLDLLAHRHAEVLGAEGELIVERASALAGRQRDRIVALLDYAEASSATVSLERVELGAALEEACARTGLALGGVVAHVQGDDHTVHADRHQVVRVLELLVERAVRTAGATTVNISAARDGAAVVVTVTDDGKAPSPEAAAAMFSDASAGHDADGVGMLVARRIVERHGGTMWAKPGTITGTVVTFTLPEGPRP